MRSVRRLLFDEKKVLDLYGRDILSKQWMNTHKEFYSFSASWEKINEMPEVEFRHLKVSDYRKDTVQENVKNLKELIQLINWFAPQARIYFVLLPRYYMYEQLYEKLSVEWKKMFYDEIDPYMKKRIPLLNYKKCEAIGRNRYFYSDIVHLNYNGAVAFTTMLNRDIQELEKQRENNGEREQFS